MLMTHFAILDAGKTEPGRLERWAQTLQRFFGLVDVNVDADPEHEMGAPRALTTYEKPPRDASTRPILRVVHIEPEVTRPAGGFRWRKHPQLLNTATADLPADQRGARHDAVRGLYAARAGALDVAIEHFTRAAQCPDIDLSHIPGFWQLSRSAMGTAVEAYEEVGRIRDAAALNARIRTMYRPRALTPVPDNVTPLPERPSRISSNS